ncbi:MAG: hypothetical protein WCC17_22070, partial [Candidatus Nitrosopolaris sp.]
DFLQTAEQRQGMDAIDKFAKSKARYPLLGMQLNDILIFGHTHNGPTYIDIENSVVNTGAWIADMLVPKWFEEEYGQDRSCSGWYVEINNGEYKLVPYGIHPKTKEVRKHSESSQEEKNKKKKEDQKENIVSKAASQVGGVEKQMVEAGSSAVKQDKSTHSDDSESKNS